MISKTIVVKCIDGLRGKTAANFIMHAERFKSTVELSLFQKNNFGKDVMTKPVNGKSMLYIMSLQIKQKQKIQLYIDGIDEQEALISLEKLLNQPCIIAKNCKKK